MTSPDTIERVLSLCPRVHIYNIPPLTSNKGHTAALWTADPTRQIFTARLRVLESATPSPLTSDDNNDNEGNETITIKILLEDPATGELFASAPYAHASAVEPAVDSSRFFAVRVVSEEAGVKQQAMLGIGFEDRADAVDFGICLQEARKVLGFGGGEAGGAVGGGVAPGGGGKGGGGGKVGRTGGFSMAEGGAKGGGGGAAETKKDWSLKEGETIKIDVVGRRRSPRNNGSEDGDRSGNVAETGDANAALFSIKPPPPPLPLSPQPPSSSSSSSSPPPSESSTSANPGTIPMLAPPPRASEARAERRRSREVTLPKKKSEAAAAAGFDDGEFGEFQ